MSRGGKSTPVLSVVVPCYNESDALDECHRRLTAVLSSLGEPYELVFVDDGSRDKTPELLHRLHTANFAVVVVRLSRNFGHQIAMSAGLEHARGRAAIIMDCDLQDPPELIPEMVAKWREGYQVVYGVRTARAGESVFKRWTAKLFYRMINLVTDTPIPLDTGDFRLLDRQALDALLRMPERHRMLRAMSSWIGFRQCALQHERAPRYAGTTKYQLRKMINFALDGIVSFSTLPLRLITFAGFAAALLAIVGILYALVLRLFTSIWVPGWTLLFVGLLFLGGLQMISLGLLGEYIGRIYTEVKHRPLYVAAEVLAHNEMAAEAVPGTRRIEPC